MKVRAGSMKDAALRTFAKVMNFLIPGSVECAANCGVCGREINEDDVERHFSHFHPEVR